MSVKKSSLKFHNVRNFTEVRWYLIFFFFVSSLSTLSDYQISWLFFCNTGLVTPNRSNIYQREAILDDRRDIGSESRVRTSQIRGKKKTSFDLSLVQNLVFCFCRCQLWVQDIKWYKMLSLSSIDPDGT